MLRTASFLIFAWFMATAGSVASGQEPAEPALTQTYLKLMKNGSEQEKIEVLQALGFSSARSAGSVEIYALALQASNPDSVKLAAAKAIETAFRGNQILKSEITKELIAILQTNNSALLDAAAGALYYTGRGYPYTEAETKILAAALATAPKNIVYKLLWTIPSLDLKTSEALYPSVQKLLEHEDDYVREVATRTLSEMKGVPKEAISNAIRLLATETSERAGTQLISLLSTAEYTPEIEKALLKAVENPTGSIRLAASFVLGTKGKNAATAVPELLALVEGGGVGRLSATRALLYLAPIVPKAEAFKVMEAAYRRESGPAKAVFLAAVLAFADPADSEQKTAIDSGLKEARKVISKSLTLSTRDSEVHTLFELLPYAAPNSSVLLPELFKNFERYTEHHSGQVDTRLQEAIVHLALVTAPDPASPSPLVTIVKDAGDPLHVRFYFSTGCRAMDMLPLSPRNHLKAHLSLLMEALEDPKQSDELRRGLLLVFPEFGKAGLDFEDRLKEIKKSSEGEKFAEHIDMVIEELHSPNQ